MAEEKKMIKPKYTGFLEALEFYKENYRHPRVPELDGPGAFDLLTDNSAPSNDEFKCEAKWPECWIHGDRSGIYAILDKELNLLLIGQSIILGNRLGSPDCRFPGVEGCDHPAQPYGRNNNGERWKDVGWSADPRYVLTVAVPDGMKWERLGLEEYLISRLQPPDNDRGKYT